MSKRNNRDRQPQALVISGEATTSRDRAASGGGATPKAQLAVATIDSKQNVKPHLRCPGCWNGLGGTGKEKWWRRVNGTLVRRAYSCNQCGAKWTVKVRTLSVIEGTEQEIIENGGDE